MTIEFSDRPGRSLRSRSQAYFGRAIGPSGGATAAAIVSSYLPSDNPGSLVAWFRQGVGVTITGAGVSQWTDQSGSGNHLLQGTDGNRPDYDESAIITFNGTDDFLKCTNFTLNQPSQVSILFNPITWTFNDSIFDGSITDRCRLAQWQPGNRLTLINSGGEVVADNLDATPGAFHAVSTLFSGASSSIKVDNNAATTGNAGAGVAGGFTLARNGGTASGFGNIAVKEIIIRNVDDATIRAADHAYLMTL